MNDQKINVSIERFGIFLIRDPIALAIYVYHMTNWTSIEREEIGWKEKIPRIANNFNLTILEVNRALDYLEKTGIG